jgi:hypothetical protein
MNEYYQQVVEGIMAELKDLLCQVSFVSSDAGLKFRVVPHNAVDTWKLSEAMSGNCHNGYATDPVFVENSDGSFFVTIFPD